MLQCAIGCKLNASKIVFFPLSTVKCIFSKLQVVIFYFQLALHSGSFCRCVTNTSLDSANNRWRVQLCMIKCFVVHILPDQSDVSARNPFLDPLVSVPVLGSFVSLFLHLHFNVYCYLLLSLFTLSLSLPFSLALIWYTFRSLLKDKSGCFFFHGADKQKTLFEMVHRHNKLLYSNLGVKNVQDCSTFCPWCATYGHSAYLKRLQQTRQQFPESVASQLCHPLLACLFGPVDNRM